MVGLSLMCFKTKNVHELFVLISLLLCDINTVNNILHGFFVSSFASDYAHMKFIGFNFTFFFFSYCFDDCDFQTFQPIYLTMGNSTIRVL